jgi:hypothetical protein
MFLFAKRHILHMKFFSPNQHAHSQTAEPQRKPSFFHRMGAMREGIASKARVAATWILITTMLPLAGCSKKFETPEAALRSMLAFALSVDTKGCADPFEAYKKILLEFNAQKFSVTVITAGETEGGQLGISARDVSIRVPYCPAFITYGGEDTAPVERIIPLNNGADANIMETWKDPALVVWAQAAQMIYGQAATEINPAIVVQAANALVAGEPASNAQCSKADVTKRVAGANYPISATDAAVIATAAISSTGQLIAMPAVNTVKFEGDSSHSVSYVPFMLAVIPSSANANGEIPVTILDPQSAQTWPSVQSFLTWSATEAMQVLPWPDSSGVVSSSLLILPPSSFLSDRAVQCFRMNDDSAGVSRFEGEQFFLSRQDSAYYYLTTTNSYDYALLLNQFTVAQFPAVRTNIEDLQKKQREHEKERKKQERKGETLNMLNI